MNPTLAYYEAQAAQFAAATRCVDFSSIQNRFAARVPANSRILDLGCGSGRDTRAFEQMGLQVDAADGSAAMCREAAAYLGHPVMHLRFDELDFSAVYEGIWACACLLHVPPEQIQDILARIHRALKPGGIFYCSFKYGTFCGYRQGRFFQNHTETTFANLVSALPGFSILEMWQSLDARPGRKEERWLNVLLQKQPDPHPAAPAVPQPDHP